MYDLNPEIGNQPQRTMQGAQFVNLSGQSVRRSTRTTKNPNLQNSNGSDLNGILRPIYDKVSQLRASFSQYLDMISSQPPTD